MSSKTDQPITITPGNFGAEDEYGKARLADLCEEDKMKVAKLIEQLMKLGAENEMANSQYDEERQAMVKRLELAEEQAKAVAADHEGMQSKYSKSLEMIQGYQLRLRELAAERESAYSESRRSKLENESVAIRERDLQTELERLRQLAENQSSDLEKYSAMEENQTNLVAKLQAQLISKQKVSRQAAALAASKSPASALSVKEAIENPISPTVASDSSNDATVDLKIPQFTPRTKKKLGSITSEVVEKLEVELTSARDALAKLRDEQMKNDAILETADRGRRNENKESSWQQMGEDTVPDDGSAAATPTREVDDSVLPPHRQRENRGCWYTFRLGSLCHIRICPPRGQIYCTEGRHHLPPPHHPQWSICRRCIAHSSAFVFPAVLSPSRQSRERRE